MISRIDMLDTCEPVEPCFFDDNDELDEMNFFPALITNHDMWKKFELLPTPPLSPRRDSDIIDMDCSSLLDPEISSIHFQLSNFDGKDHPPEKVLYPESPPSLTKCQDPMWSGHVMDGEIQKISEEQKNYDSKPVPVRTDTPSVGLGPNETECIDPQSVFAYNLPETTTSEPVYRNMGTDTPSDSEDEIDVVSVPNKKPTPPVSQPQIKKTIVTSLLLSHALSDVRTTHNYSKPHIHVSYTPHKNKHHAKRTMKFVIPSSSLLKRNRTLVNSSMAFTPSSPKRVKCEPVPPTDCTDIDAIIDCLDTSDSRTCFTRSFRRSPRNSPESSDNDMVEGPIKRNQHNVLERKRRNDLKSSFYMLKDEVPELCRTDRAPKVTILQKAQEFIRELKQNQTQLNREEEKLKSRRKQLVEKLNLLQQLEVYDDLTDLKYDYEM